ncbi:MAG: hypothetical protein IPO91_07535 [Chloroflexi bacterium]|nr:hypothetical protein [Chloroflexota bacterium]
MKSLFRTFLEILILPLKQRIARISTATGSRVSPVVGNAEKSSSAPSSEETEFEELVTQYVAVEMSDTYGTRLAADEEENVPHLVPEDFSVLSRFLDPVEENDVLVADMDEEVGEGKRLEVPTAFDVPVIEIETHPEIVEKPIVEAVQPPLFQEMVSPTPTIDTPITSELLNPEQLELNDESGEDQAVDASAQIDAPSFSELEFTVSDHEQPSPISVQEDLVLAVDSAPNMDKAVAPTPDLPSTDALPIFDVSSIELIDLPVEEATLTWKLSDEVRFQFDKHEPETSLKDELDNFLEQLAMGGIRASLSISEIEQLLRLAFRRVELIGELPVSREAFEQLSAILRGRFAPNGRRLSLREANCPALFSTTMVFCARYSDEDARSFWRPFAQKVWHLKGTDQSFQVMCANFFFKSRLYLEERYNLIFPVINRGDVVRPLYRHAILPFYLQSDFAAWLIRNLRLMQDVALEHLPSQLAETKLDYESKSLKQFIRAEETRETAYHLIRQMKRAIDLFVQEGDSEAVRSELSSPIERELWDQIAHVLTQTVERRASTRQAQTRLEWVWSLEDDEMFLRLLNLRVTDEAGKPDVCQWVKQQGMPVHGDGVTEYLRPWENDDGWLVDEVLIPAPSSTGWIYVLSEEGDMLYENPVPPLPTKPYMLFRLTQQRQYGIPVDDAEIAEGDWLLSTAAGIAIHTDHGQVLTPREIREPTSMLRETAAHRNAEVYELHPPTRLLKDGSVIAEWGKKQTTVGQPSIEGDSPLADISVSVPPVFMSRDIYLRIPQFNERANRITLSLKGGAVNLVLRMDRLLETGRAEVSADEIVVHLGELIPDANATYLVNLRRDLQSILPSPLQFTLLTGIEVAPPNPDIIYSPTCLPSVRIQGLEAEHVELPQGSTLQTVDQALFVEWHELKDNLCKLRLRFSHTIIPLAWSINRVNAWIEGVDGDSVYEGQLIGVTLRARGNRYDSLRWIMESGDTTDSRDITLNAGEVTTIL